MGSLKKEQLAIGNYHYVAYSFDYFLNSAESMGLKNIEIWGAKPHLCIGIHDEAYIREMRKKIDAKGLRVICFCPEQNTYPVDISTGNEPLRRASLEHLKRSIESAHLLGAKKMLLCPGNGYVDEEPEAIWERFRSSVTELAKAAQDHDVVLALETQAQEDSLFMNTVRQQKQILEEVDHPYFKAMLDTVQLAQFDTGMKESLDTLGMENMVHVHLGNTIMREKTSGEKQLPEYLCRGRSVVGHIGFLEGNLPLGRYLKELADADYQEFVTIEICQRPYYFEADRYGREALEYTLNAIL